MATNLFSMAPKLGLPKNKNLPSGCFSRGRRRSDTPTARRGNYSLDVNHPSFVGPTQRQAGAQSRKLCKPITDIIGEQLRAKWVKRRTVPTIDQAALVLPPRTVRGPQRGVLSRLVTEGGNGVAAVRLILALGSTSIVTPSLLQSACSRDKALCEARSAQAAVKFTMERACQASSSKIGYVRPTFDPPAK